MADARTLVIWWRDHKVCLAHDPELHDYPFEAGRLELVSSDAKLLAFLRAFSRSEPDSPADEFEGMADEDIEPYMDEWSLERPDGIRFIMNPPLIKWDESKVLWFVTTQELPPRST